MGLMFSTFIFILLFYFLRYIYLLIFMILFSFWTVFFLITIFFSFLRRFHSSLQQTYVCYVRLVRERVPKAVKKAIFVSTMKARNVTSANLVR